MALIDRSPSLGPFVRLPAPHADILLTTLLPGDAAALVELYNTPSIGHRLYSTPFPYVQFSFQLQPALCMTLTIIGHFYSYSTADGERSIAKEAPAAAALQARLDAGDHQPLDAYPLTAIRIETEEGSTRLIGTVGVHAAEPNSAFPFRENCWDLGYVLLPSFGGRGIGTAAPRAALAAWEQLGNVKAFGAYGTPPFACRSEWDLR
jgi:RimJ/RimL family protein N-acetyltransferase